MKIKVLLVDDEKLERVLIRNGFDWEEHGFEIAGEVSGGMQALEFVEHQEADVIFTDINMPEMDGLEFIQKLRETGRECPVVIITGYREFEYARKAVRLGVEEFLLKPVDFRELQEIAERLKKQIVEKKRNSQEFKRLREREIADQDIVMESFFQRLTAGRVEREEAFERLSLYNVAAVAESCICAAIKPVTQAEGVLQEILKKVKGRGYADSISFLHYSGQVLIYFHGWTPGQVKAEMESLRKFWVEQEKLNTDIGISERAEGIDGIMYACRQAAEAVEATAYFGKGSCILYHDLEKVARKVGHVEIDWADFLLCVQNGAEGKTQEYIDLYIDRIKEAGVMDKSYLRLLTMNMLSKAGTAMNRYGTSLGELLGEENLYDTIHTLETIEEIRQFLKETIHKVVGYFKGKAITKGNKVISQVAEYIAEHLYEPELSLRTIAAANYLNESYLSRLFKKEMDESITEYIMKKRMEEGVRLLEETDKKVYEIAEAVGFRDSHYFSICFKRIVGVTIKEYKAGKRVKITT